MKTPYHEKETITLRHTRPQPRPVLHEWFIARGYKSEDDFYYLPRKGRIEPWQTATLMTVDVFLGGQKVFETEEDVELGESSDWDSLQVNYLMATTPRECLASFVGEIAELSSIFQLKIEFESDEQSLQSLSEKLNRIADELETNWSGPGTEMLAILIEQEY